LVLFLGLSLVGGCSDDPELVEVCAFEYDIWVREGSTSEPSTWPDQEDILGTYWLAGIEIDLFVNGTPAGVVSGDDLGTWSGDLVIDESMLTATVTLEGETAAVSGSYTRTVEGEARGLFSIEDPSGTFEYNYILGEDAEVELPDRELVHGLLWYPTEPFCEMVEL
jgi:hypothetical protein